MLAQALRAEPGRRRWRTRRALRAFDSSALAVLLDCRREALALGKTFAVSQHAAAAARPGQRCTAWPTAARHAR